MTKYSKFDEIKIKLAMDHRGLSREEAVIELKLGKALKGDDQHSASTEVKKTGSPKHRRHANLGLVMEEDLLDGLV